MSGTRSLTKQALEWGIIMSLCLSGFAFAANTTLEGVLEEYDTDDNDNVISVALSIEETDEEGDKIHRVVRIVNNSKAKALFDHVGSKVQVTGILGQDEPEEEYIQIISHTILETPPPTNEPDIIEDDSEE